MKLVNKNIIKFSNNLKKYKRTLVLLARNFKIKQIQQGKINANNKYLNIYPNLL